jgi:hypothetical protein
VVQSITRPGKLTAPGPQLDHVGGAGQVDGDVEVIDDLARRQQPGLERDLLPVLADRHGDLRQPYVDPDAGCLGSGR